MYQAPLSKIKAEGFKSKRKRAENGAYEPHVYVIRDSLTGKKYIGSRTAKGCRLEDLGRVYFSSGVLSEQWAGDPSSVSVEEVIPCWSNQCALLLEKDMILCAFEENPSGVLNRGWAAATFNMTGHTFSHTEEVKGRISTAKMGALNPRYGKPGTMLGRKTSEETKAKLSKINTGKNNPRWGLKFPHSDEAKANISAAQVGRVNSPESNAKRSAALKGRKRPDWVVDKISNSQRGKVISTEARYKISKAHKGKEITPEVREKISQGMKTVPKKQCPHCDRWFSPQMFGRYHGQRCKKNQTTS